MDGPNVNWKLNYGKMDFIQLQSILVLVVSTQCITALLKAGIVATEWRVSPIFEDFVMIIGNSQLPLKFVSHTSRLLENVVVSETPLTCGTISSSMLKQWKRERGIPSPGNRSFQVVKEAVDDKLVLDKQHYLECIASQLQPFLANYRTEKPVVCFLVTDLNTALRDLLRRCALWSN